MNNTRPTLTVAVVLSVLSSGWLLSALGFLPATDRLAAMGIGLLGLGTLAFGRVGRSTFVIGFFLLSAAVISLMRTTGLLPTETVLPALLTSLGVVLMASHAVPVSRVTTPVQRVEIRRVSTPAREPALKA